MALLSSTRILVCHRFSAVPCQRHGRGWTWDLDGLVILRKNIGLPSVSRLSPAQRHGRGWTWGLDGLKYTPKNIGLTIGSRLSPARDTAEGGLGILMALLSSKNIGLPSVLGCPLPETGPRVDLGS